MELRMRRPFDAHVHFRQGELMKVVIGFTTSVFGQAVVMPNTDPPILNAQDATEYRLRIIEANSHLNTFDPFMTIKITPETTPQMIRRAKQEGVKAGKLYPEGATTGAEKGVRNFKDLYPVFCEMARVGMVLSVHGESPGTFCLDRERVFLTILSRIRLDFPKLKIILEHLSTAKAVDYIRTFGGSNLAGTITAHHLSATLDNLLGGKLNPHYFCKPLLGNLEDQKALIKAATSGNCHFFFGSDSAPHFRQQKECQVGAAGVFSAPTALSIVTEIFEQAGALDKLEDFCSINGRLFYGAFLPREQVTIIKSPWQVPQTYYDGKLVPFKAGETLAWQVST